MDPEILMGMATGGGGSGDMLGSVGMMAGGPIGGMAGSMVGSITDAAMGGGEGPSSATSGFTGDLSVETTTTFGAKDNGVTNKTLMIVSGVGAIALVAFLVIRKG